MKIGPFSREMTGRPLVSKVMHTIEPVIDGSATTSITKPGLVRNRPASALPPFQVTAGHGPTLPNSPITRTADHLESSKSTSRQFFAASFEPLQLASVTKV